MRYALEAIRRQLAGRAGLPMTAPSAPGILRGHVDDCDGVQVLGWAQDIAHPNVPVCLDILVDGAVVGLAYADRPRADLAAAGIGDGAHAFCFRLPRVLAAQQGHEIGIRRSVDGSMLSGSSMVTARAEIAA